MIAPFTFATGIENSDPTLQGSKVRVDRWKKTSKQ